MNRFQRSVLAGCILSLTAGNLYATTNSTAGQQLYEHHCSICHPMTPPPKSAPPILGIAQHYHQTYTEKEQGVMHMVQFIKKPDAKQSILEAAAITRFGLMPAIKLSGQELTAVSEWLWESYDPQFTSPGNCKQ